MASPPDEESSSDSPEHIALRKSYKLLIDSPLKHNLTSLSDTLYSVGLIPEDIHEFVSDNYQELPTRTRRLLSYVMSKMKIKPGVFYHFLEILEKEGSWAQEIVASSKEIYQEEYENEKKHLKGTFLIIIIIIFKL